MGRAAELAEVASLLHTTRLLTLTGVGGVGKTRLALQAAGCVREDYPDGVWLFELAPATDETAIVSTITAAFEMTATGPDRKDAVLEQICAYLASRGTLLLFDNCEHVIDLIAAVVQTVLAACPRVRVLATSRELLRLPGEVRMAVPPLALPPPDPVEPAELVACDAVALFCERAQDARPEFQLTDANAPAVVAICRRLDGIPLALELAAARMRMLTVAQIAERLDDCFRLLGEGARTAVPRQQTLRATLDWSYQLLSPAERRALARLAVFPDRFNLDAAIAVATDTSLIDSCDGLEVLAPLVDKSLVIADDTGDEVRFRLLEPIRQYAAEKLSEAGEARLARRRHRDFFLAHSVAWAAELIETKSRRIMADLANYHAALEWSWAERNLDAALRLVVFQSSTRVKGRAVEGRQWLERVLAEPEPADHPARAQALACLALLVHESGRPDPTRSARLMHEAIALARRLADPALVAWVGYYSAELDLAWGRTDEARRLVEGALATYERAGSAVSAGWCHHCLGWAAVADRDQRLARTHFQRAAELSGPGDDGRWLAAHALAAIGPLTVMLGDAGDGLRVADEAVLTARGLAIRSVLVMALTRAAETAILAGSYRHAASAVTEVLRLLRDQASRPWVADALEMAAIVLETNQDGETAVELLRAAGALRVASGERAGGTRSIAGTVQQASDRLIAVGSSVAATPRPDALPPDAAIAEALARLTAARSAVASW